MNRRNIVIGGGIVALAAVGAGAYALVGNGKPASSARETEPVQLADAGALFEDDRILGNPDAPLTVIEFASMTCPHCANFHKTIYPDLKANWIDSGKARFIFRHFPLDAWRCAPRPWPSVSRANPFSPLSTSCSLSSTNGPARKIPLAALRALARQVGMDEETSGACLRVTREKMDRIFEIVADGKKNYKISSTPSFVLNGRKANNSGLLRSF